MIITRFVRHLVMRPFIIVGVFVLAALLCACMCGAIALSGGGRTQNAPPSAPAAHVVSAVAIAGY